MISTIGVLVFAGGVVLAGFGLRYVLDAILIIVASFDIED